MLALLPLKIYNLETYAHEIDETYVVTIDGESIEATPEHPFYNAEGEEVQAKDLKEGDELASANGDTATVDSVECIHHDEPVMVYNIAVCDSHTYFVGENHVLVHNMCPPKQEIPKNGENKTPRDAYTFGNSTSPRGARPQQDFGVEGYDSFVGPESGPFPRGASTFSDVSSVPLTGHYYSLPSGTDLPSGLDIIPDGMDVIPGSPHGPGHMTIFPSNEMTVSEFNELFQSLPWKYGGKK